MTLECYWEFNRNGITTKIDEEVDPLIVKWIDNLGLQKENIKVIKESGIDGYAGIKVYYDHNIDYWIIKYSLGLDLNHVLHKLGYIWIWKITFVLDRIKKNWRNKDNIFVLAESCVLDNVVFSRFCNMDVDFKEFWLNYTIEECKHWYNGRSWYKSLPNMLYQYIVNYLNYNFVWPEELRNKYSDFIMVELLKRRSEILEKSQIESVYFTKKDLRILDRILRKFVIIIDSMDYRRIEGYILQLQEYFYRLS